MCFMLCPDELIYSIACYDNLRGLLIMSLKCHYVVFRYNFSLCCVHVEDIIHSRVILCPWVITIWKGYLKTIRKLDYVDVISFDFDS